MSAAKKFLCLVVLGLLSFCVWFSEAQTSLLDTINAELGSLSITIPLNNEVVNIPPQDPLDGTDVTLIEAVCDGFSVGSITLSGAESGTANVDGVNYEKYTISAGVSDITVNCVLSISTRSTGCGVVR